VLLGRWRGFLRDWVPFVLLIFGYELLRGAAGEIVGGDAAAMGPYDPARSGQIVVEPLIAADRWLFGGQLPVAWLQDRLYEPGRVHWYDTVAVVVYALHSVLPLVFAFLLWLRRRDRFRQFSLAFLAMTYAAFAFFLLVPAAPPWLAERWGLTEGLVLPADQALAALVPGEYTNLDSLRIWNQASPNPVAALPSLHAAFPWLVLLFAVRYGRWLGLVFLPHNAALWFSVVYLAQHWVVDILAGIAWATLWFAVTVRLWPRLERALREPPRWRPRASDP
jgi:membrane-associated phospholipid phosphatase